jgi:hypothetical protein
MAARTGLDFNLRLLESTALRPRLSNVAPSALFRHPTE